MKAVDRALGNWQAIRMSRLAIAPAFATLSLLLVSCGPKDADKAAMRERAWQVPANLHQLLIQEVDRQAVKDDPFEGMHDGGVTVDVFLPDLTLPGVFEHGFDIPFPEEASVRFSPNRGELVVYHFPDGLEQIDQVIRALNLIDRTVFREEIFHPIGRMAVDGGDFSKGLHKWEWHLSSEVIEALKAPLQADSTWEDLFGASDPSPPRPELALKQVFQMSGVSFPEGASISYDKESQRLTCVNEREQTVRAELLLLWAAHGLAESAE